MRRRPGARATAQRSREDELEISQAQITLKITGVTQLQHARPVGHIPTLSPGSTGFPNERGRKRLEINLESNWAGSE